MVVFQIEMIVLNEIDYIFLTTYNPETKNLYLKLKFCLINFGIANIKFEFKYF